MLIWSYICLQGRKYLQHISSSRLWNLITVLKLLPEKVPPGWDLAGPRTVQDPRNSFSYWQEPIVTEEFLRHSLYYFPVYNWVGAIMKMQASPQHYRNFYCDGKIPACFLLPPGLNAADVFCNYLPKVTEAWLMNLNIDVYLRTVSSHLRIRLLLLSCVITTTKAEAKDPGSSFAPQFPSCMTGHLIVSCVTEGYCMLFFRAIKYTCLLGGKQQQIPFSDRV